MQKNRKIKMSKPFRYLANSVNKKYLETSDQKKVKKKNNFRLKKMLQPPVMNLSYIEQNSERFAICQNSVNFTHGHSPSSSRSSAYFPKNNLRTIGGDISFTIEQIECICENLQNTESIERLKQFLWSLPACAKVQRNESVVKSKALLAFWQRKYRELYRILESQQFSTSNHEKLQALWIQGD